MPKVSEHVALNDWVDEMARMCQPDRVVWIDGSEQERYRLTEEALGTGELLPLDQRKWPGCVYHRTAVNDVARTEHLTYICTRRREDAGPTNQWMSPAEGYRRAREIFQGSMRGRTMYVIPFSMGPIGSPFSLIGVELTDSIYVVLNMRIMARVGLPVLKQLGTAGEFTRCLHGKAELDVNRRLILHFPEDNTIWSVGSGYGGNVLLGKKCLALRIASYLGRRDGWLAEHMLIMGVEDPDGRIDYLAAAFPSACGKTNLAMLVPPEGLRQNGYRIWTVGDDIAWMRIDTDGRLWAINPETGFFGVAPGTNSRTNPNMIKTISRNTIFTNVVLGADGDLWWEDGEGPPPAEAWDWQGRPWQQGAKDAEGNPILGAHPNSRFTAPISQCPSHSFRLEHHHGVPISAIVFGGRRAHLAPLVYEAFDWEHGVFVGATMASERTAAQYGALGEVRRDPMAMLPFCGYHMGDYFEHWLETGRRMQQPPRVFHVNWFRTGEDGKSFLWPGYGDNLRVIEWILGRCRGEADARETPIGYVPIPESLDLGGLQMSPATLEGLLAVDREAWQEESRAIEEFFRQFSSRFPRELWEQHAALKARLESSARLLRPGRELRPQAAQLNDVISAENPAVFAMLSQLGKRLFSPAGPAAARPELSQRWRGELLARHAELRTEPLTVPLPTGGVSQALSLVGDLFLDSGDQVLMPDPFWENYELLFGVRLQAQIVLYPFFTGAGGFNVDGLRAALADRAKHGKAMAVLSSPNNPAGHAITFEEADAIAEALRESAEGGLNVVAVCDDACFGRAQEEGLPLGAVFTRLAGLHDRILAVKVDGPVKDEYVSGFPAVMLTLSARAKERSQMLLEALESKVAGAIHSVAMGDPSAAQPFAG